MGLWPCQLKMRNRLVLPQWLNEEPGMEMRIKHALKVFSSQPIVPPLSLVISGSLAQCQEKVTCQTDTPCSSNGTQKHTLNLFSLLSSCQSKGWNAGQVKMGTGFSWLSRMKNLGGREQEVRPRVGAWKPIIGIFTTLSRNWELLSASLVEKEQGRGCSRTNMVPGLVLGHVSCRNGSFSPSLSSQGCGMGMGIRAACCEDFVRHCLWKGCVN